MRPRHALILALAASATRTAHADPFAVFGLTSRRAAQANAGAASVDDASALYYDPAGLVGGPAEVELGAIGGFSHLAVGDTTSSSLSDPYGFQLAVRAPVPLRGALHGRIAVGIALHMLPVDITRVTAPAPDRAFYPMYGDSTSRLVVMPGAAVKLGHGISAGVAINVLAGLSGTIYAAEGATRAIDSRVDERAQTIARFNAGVAWQLRPDLRVAAVYREKFEVPFETAATTLVAGEPIDIDLRAVGQFTPDELVLGGAWSPDPLTLSLDVEYARWSSYPGPYVHVDSTLPLIGAVPGQTPSVPFKDTLAIRLGAESKLPRGHCGFIWRGGVAFETSPVPAVQTGITNLLDGPKETIAGGVGYSWPHVGKGVRLDAHLMLQIVDSRTITKQIWDGTGTYDPFTSLRDEDINTPGTQISNPGYPSIKSGGEVVSGGVTLEVGL